MPPKTKQMRGGRCAIVGRPNVGKSTLLNAMLGQKLVIMTSKPGTTRSNVLGVYAAEGMQLAFIDTPGLHRPKSALGKVLVEEARLGAATSDVILMIVEATSVKDQSKGDRDVLEMAKQTGKPVVLAVNKIDRLKEKSRLLPVLADWQAQHDFAAIVPISAKQRVNLDQLASELRALLPEGRLYDDEFLTDKPERFFVAELIREAVMQNTREEVPYGIAVEIEEYVESERLVRINATILVEKPGHKKIVIGSKGALLKKIGTEARLGIEALVGRKVFLELFVKVLEGWTEDPLRARRMVREGVS